MPGGEDISFRMEAEMLRRHGSEVATYEDDNERVKNVGHIRTAMSSIWAQDTYRKVRAMLREGRFDVLHVQNFFPLISPAIYHAARAEGIPVVQSLRNYRLLCPVGTFNRDGKICEACMSRRFAWPAVKNACYRGSMFGTLAVSGMLSIHRYFGTWSDKIDGYIAMTEFMRRKFVQGGFPAGKIFVKPNFLFPDPQPGDRTGDYALYVGRLDREKGIETLLKAWQAAGVAMPLKVVGAGPLEPLLSDGALPQSVEYLGWQPPETVRALMGAGRFMVLPTEWYEGHPRTAVEAFARGLPVIASRIGAIPEIVEDARTGLLFTPGDADDLVAKIRHAAVNREQMAEIGMRGREEYLRRYTDTTNYERLIKIYEHCIEARQERRRGSDLARARARTKANGIS